MSSNNSESASSCQLLGPSEKIIRALAGSFVIISVLLGYFVSPYWFLFTLFVGVNLFQSSFTNWCLAETIIRKCGLVEVEKEA